MTQRDQCRQQIAPPRLLAEPLSLRSGLVLKNRIAKASTSEALADSHHCPTAELSRLYETFALGGAGLVVTGNVLVDARHLERPRNVVVEDERHLTALRAWAEAASARGTPVLVQLNHAGRQCHRLISRQPVGPSAGSPVKLLSAYAPPRALAASEIDDVVSRFARAAQVLQRAGFAGVQVDAAHGYLLSQFLSPLVNRRNDGWGGPLENRARLLLEIVRAVRACTGASFTLAVKLNSADFQRGGFGEDEALQVIDWLSCEGVDLLEISGGTYEAPALLGLAAESTRAREAYFLEFGRRVRRRCRIPLMVTGGFRSRAVMEGALADDALDVIGLARPLLLEPDLPARLLAGATERAVARTPPRLPRALASLVEAGYYHGQIVRLAQGKRPQHGLSVSRAVARYVNDELAAALARQLRLPPRRRRLPATCTSSKASS